MAPFKASLDSGISEFSQCVATLIAPVGIWSDQGKWACPTWHQVFLPKEKKKHEYRADACTPSRKTLSRRSCLSFFSRLNVTLSIIAFSTAASILGFREANLRACSFVPLQSSNCPSWSIAGMAQQMQRTQRHRKTRHLAEQTYNNTQPFQFACDNM